MHDKSTKIAAIIIVVLAILAGTFGYLIYQNPEVILRNYAADHSSAKESAPEKPASAQAEKSVSSIKVTYTKQNGFTPKTVTIEAGQTVKWVNNREDRPMWVASDAHPTHEKLPAFDAAKVLGHYPKPGENFSYTFEKTGTWTYHDHADASQTGTVVVR